LAKIFRGSSQDSSIVFCKAKNKIAIPAKQSTNFSREMAMINLKNTFFFGMIIANCAFIILEGSHLIVQGLTYAITIKFNPSLNPVSSTKKATAIFPSTGG